MGGCSFYISNIAYLAAGFKDFFIFKKYIDKAITLALKQRQRIVIFVKEILWHDKGSDFIMNSKFMLYGEKVIVCPLNQSNVKSYLSVYKGASAFSEVYEMMPDLWENPRKCIENYVVGEKGSKARYLVAEKESSQGCGYIELDYDNPEMPEVDIAILEEYRKKGYAFEAAKILFENIFEKESVKCVIWSAFSSNIASCRIAEKLGGIVVEGKNLIVEAMYAAGLKMDSVNAKEIPKTITYEIKRGKSR